MNSIQPGSFVTLHYRLAGPDGAAIVDTFGDRPATLSLGAGQLAPAIERRLIGLPEGARDAFSLAPGEAFGERRPEMLQRVSRAMLAAQGGGDDGYAIGDVVEFPAPEGGASCAGVVREMDQDGLLFDFNHPLAGRPLTFEVHVIGVL